MEELHVHNIEDDRNLGIKLPFFVNYPHDTHYIMNGSEVVCVGSVEQVVKYIKER